MHNSIAPVSRPQNLHQGSFPNSSFEPSKPVLPRLLKTRDALGKAGDLASHLTLNRLEREHVELQLLSKEEITQMLNQSWSDQAWEYFSVVSTAVASLISFGLGVYLLGSSPDTVAAGSALMAASLCEIIKALFSHYDMWDTIAEALAEKNQNVKDQLKKELPLLLSFVNVACSFFALQGLGTHKELLATLQFGLSLINAGGEGYFFLQKANADVKSSEIRADISLHKQNTELLSRLVTVLIEETRRLKSVLKKPILSIMQAGTLAAQKI